MPAEKHFTADTRGDLTIIHFAPHILLTGPIAQEVGGSLSQLIEVQGCRRLVLNFANVGGLTSLMIAKLLVLHKAIQAKGGRVVLCEVSEVIREILDLVKVTTLIPISPTQQDALESMP
jgi:anti-anti-sigma factor